MKDLNLSQTPNTLAHRICEKGLRYDLTVPFARFVVMHQQEIAFPFKRYQIQPVWRADRPQKGRYREFYQCDVDVIGSNSLLNEAELMQITDEIFTHFGIDITIKINNRKILSGLAEIVGEADKSVDICTAIDKLDKIGKENVNKELLERGLSQEAIDKLQPSLEISGTNLEKLKKLETLFADSSIGLLVLKRSERCLNIQNIFICVLRLNLIFHWLVVLITIPELSLKLRLIRLPWEVFPAGGAMTT
jgi:histidyl-tRNA synthetase